MFFFIILYSRAFVKYCEVSFWLGFCCIFTEKLILTPIWPQNTKKEKWSRTTYLAPFPFIDWQLPQIHPAAKRSHSQVSAWAGTLWLISGQWWFADTEYRIADRLPRCSYLQSPQGSAESNLAVVLQQLHRIALAAYRAVKLTRFMTFHWVVEWWHHTTIKLNENVSLWGLDKKVLQWLI